MSKIAIIADIHGNREALQTALKDIKKKQCEQIICLGDIISKGKFTNECVEMVRKNCHVVLRGNCDDYFTKEHDLENLNETDRKRVVRLQSELSEENEEYLANLPFCHEFYLSGRLVRVFHAGPDSAYNYSNTLMNAPVEKKYAMFEPNVLTISDKLADVIVHGHIHTQSMNKLFHRTLICCGSIGNNLEYVRKGEWDGQVLNTTCVNYVVLEGILDSLELNEFKIEFIQVPYDVEKEIKDSEGIDEFEALAGELRNGRYRDLEKINRLLKLKN